MQTVSERARDYDNYNDRVDPAAVQALLEVNRRFYEARGEDFSATRLRIQPGVKRLLETLRGDESILDLGCGNGELARALSRRGHRGSYLGIDSSPILLARAGDHALSFPVGFVQGDLSQPTWEQSIPTPVASAGPSSTRPRFDIVTCFAFLHHMPGALLRSQILCKVRDLLVDDGRLMLSNWIFSSNSRMRSRIQPWAAVGLAPGQLDPNDYLLDWKRGGPSLRYVHEFGGSELDQLAAAGGFQIKSAFFSDGADRQSSLYQVWRKSARQ